MTLDEAKKVHEAKYRQLIKVSTRIKDGLANGLSEVRNMPIEVWRVASSELRNVTGQEANGYPAKYDGKYVIFLSDAPSYPSPRTPSLKGYWLNRLCVLHEYTHIICGNVFEDDPDRFYKLYMDITQGSPIAQNEHCDIENRADKYAFSQLAEEARNAGDTMLACELLSEIQYRGLY